MALETPQSATPATKLPATEARPLVFQTPPSLPNEINAEEHAATKTAALSYAKRIANKAAIVAGLVAGAVGGSVLIPADKTARAVRIIASAFSGGVVGYLISNLTWNQKPVSSAADSDSGLPSLPIPTPSPKPDPAPASPAPSVAQSEHNGRVDAAALEPVRTA